LLQWVTCTNLAIRSQASSGRNNIYLPRDITKLPCIVTKLHWDWKLECWQVSATFKIVIKRQYFFNPVQLCPNKFNNEWIWSTRNFIDETKTIKMNKVWWRISIVIVLWSNIFEMLKSALIVIFHRFYGPFMGFKNKPVNKSGTWSIFLEGA